MPPLMQNEQLLEKGQRYFTQDPVHSLAYGILCLQR